MLLKEKIIKKTKKVHYCNAWNWIKNSDVSEIKMTFKEQISIAKAKKKNGRIEIGSSCLYSVGVWDGDFFACYSIPELHEICIKYEIYQEC